MTEPERPRPDESMGLLQSVMNEAMDPGYAEEAAAHPRASTSRQRIGAAAIALIALVGFAAVAAGLQVRSSLPRATEARNALVERVEARTAATDALGKQAAELRDEVRALSDQAGTSSDEAIRQQVEALTLAAASEPVSGPGVVVTVDDADPDDVKDRQNPELGKVQDRDLQMVVNGLWASGAEAIAVNGQRLSSLSSIRSAGDAILVDYRPLSPPYVVEAIGNPDTMLTTFNAGVAGQSLRILSETYGIRSSVRTADDLHLPASSTGVIRKAKPLTNSGGSS